MSRVELSSSPGLAGLYVRAVRRQIPLPGALRATPLAGLAGHRGGDSLPATELVVPDVEVRREHLTEYDAVCGFRLADAAPPTYLHVVAFPLAMRLMTDDDFPFGVMGLVHIANRIEQRRAVRAGERVELRVRAADLREHARGRQLDVVGEARAGDELVWEDRSTYLRREHGGGGGRSRPDPSPPAGGAVWRVPEDVGRRYAAASGDSNPIHLHPAAAKLFGMPGMVAHGMWVNARCLAALEGRVPEACAVEVQFKLPVRLGSRVAFTSSLGADGTRSFAVAGARDGRPHLAGTVAPL